MSEKESAIESFDPNGVGVKNGRFIGLPFKEKNANIVLVSVPWDVTVSYNEGTSSGPDNILEASTQLDLYDRDIKDAWKYGIFLRPSDKKIKDSNDQLRELSKSYIDFVESGGEIKKNENQRLNLEAVNEGCENLRKLVFNQTTELLDAGKLVGVVGGEHSVPLGFIQALAQRHKSFGILQIDAHMDLRDSYEGFQLSHASIFYNVLKLKNLKKLVQVGIRDCCEAESQLAATDNRVEVFNDQEIREQQFTGKKFEKICSRIIKNLPDKVYISFDIDGLAPQYCPNTGTPVPGGLLFEEALYLIKMLAYSGRKIIGFDLCETAGTGNEWDGNVGARILYKLSNWMAWTNGLKIG